MAIGGYILVSHLSYQKKRKKNTYVNMKRLFQKGFSSDDVAWGESSIYAKKKSYVFI